MNDNTETVITFTHDDGRTIEIDHLGIAYPENRGEFGSRSRLAHRYRHHPIHETYDRRATRRTGHGV